VRINSAHVVALALTIAQAVQWITADVAGEPADQPKFRLVLQDLKESADRVSNLSKTKSEVASLAATLHGSLEILSSKAEANPNVGYVNMLYADQAAIQRFLTSPEANTTHGLFEAAVEDLRIKADQARTISGASAAVGDLVQVSVSTQHAGQTVSGYLVRANPLTVKNENPARFIFNNPTSPSEGEIPPGFVWLWIESSDGTFVKGQIMRIGGNGSPIQPPITLLIP
jgi:hypothetical protein